MNCVNVKWLGTPQKTEERIVRADHSGCDDMSSTSSSRRECMIMGFCFLDWFVKYRVMVEAQVSL